VPPRIEPRLELTGALDPQLLDLQEQMREQALYLM
jgi:4-carboxymuconolactone decarboxylase